MQSAYEVRISGNGVAGNDSSADAGQELLAGDNLLSHEMAAALRLHLILDVARRETDPSVLGNGAGDVGGSTEATSKRKLTTSTTEGRYDVPSVGISNYRHTRVERRVHLAGPDEIVHSRNGKVGLTKAGSGRGGTTALPVS